MFYWFAALLVVKQRFLIQAVFENGLDGPVGERVDSQSSCTCCFQPFIAIGFTQPENAQQASVGLLWVLALDQQRFGEQESLRPDSWLPSV